MRRRRSSSHRSHRQSCRRRSAFPLRPSPASPTFSWLQRRLRSGPPAMTGSTSWLASLEASSLLGQLWVLYTTSALSDEPMHPTCQHRTSRSKPFRGKSDRIRTLPTMRILRSAIVHRKTAKRATSMALLVCASDGGWIYRPSQVLYLQQRTGAALNRLEEAFRSSRPAAGCASGC